MITVETIRNAFMGPQPRTVADFYKSLGAEDKVAERKVRKLLQRLKKQGEVVLEPVFTKCKEGNTTTIAKKNFWQLTVKGLAKIRPAATSEKSEELPAYTRVWRVVRGLGSHGKVFTISDVATIAEAPYLDAMAAIFALTYMGYVHAADGGYKAAMCCQNRSLEPPVSAAFDTLAVLNGIIADTVALLNRIARIIP